ncbi:MAG TPA: hypothetical protein GXX53_03905 [Tissierellia bacterium]|nr:hypothetical protein [Tissierellia bacterium]
MKRYIGVYIFLFCVVLFIASFGIGYYVTSMRNRENTSISEENPTEDDFEELAILHEVERITPNTFIEIRIHYNKCNHNITKLNEKDNNIVNMTEEEYRDYLKEHYPNVKIVKFSSREIILEEERDYLCPNHYIIGEHEGKIAIFKIDENGERVLDRIFVDYPITLLKEIDQEKLKEGIIINTEDELTDVLENFIS